MKKQFCISLLIFGMLIGDVSLANSAKEPEKPNFSEMEKGIVANLKKLIDENKIKVKITSYTCAPQTHQCYVKFELQTVN